MKSYRAPGRCCASSSSPVAEGAAAGAEEEGWAIATAAAAETARRVVGSVGACHRLWSCRGSRGCHSRNSRSRTRSTTGPRSGVGCPGRHHRTRHRSRSGRCHRNRSPLAATAAAAAAAAASATGAAAAAAAGRGECRGSSPAVVRSPRSQHPIRSSPARGHTCTHYQARRRRMSRRRRIRTIPRSIAAAAAARIGPLSEGRNRGSQSRTHSRAAPALQRHRRHLAQHRCTCAHFPLHHHRTRRRRRSRTSYRSKSRAAATAATAAAGVALAMAAAAAATDSPCSPLHPERAPGSAPRAAPRNPHSQCRLGNSASHGRVRRRRTHC